MTTTTITSPAATYIGRNYADGTTRFHGIAFCQWAHPFADPTPAPDSEVIVDATQPRPQEVALTVTTPTTEVAESDQQRAGSLPVVVYLHGGRFETGTHEDPRADGAALAGLGVVSVHIGYRVGVEGLAQFEDDEPFHYRAIADCQLGLEWVQRNVDSFGGDPTNVTLVGQSAGATIALWLSRRDHYRGAFRRVLAASPCFPRAGWQQRGKLFQRCLARPITRSSLAKTKKSRLDRAYRRFRSLLFLDMALGPYPFDPGELAEVDIVATTMADEFYDLPAARRVDKLGLGALVVKMIGRTMALQPPAQSWIDRAKKIDPAHVAGRFVGDSINRRWINYLAESAPGKIWMAQFSGSPDQPALHSRELRPLFGATRSDGSTPRITETRIVRWLAGFARTGEVGWPVYSPDTGRQAVDISLIDGNWTAISDPLKYVRLGFPQSYPAHSDNP